MPQKGKLGGTSVTDIATLPAWAQVEAWAMYDDIMTKRLITSGELRIVDGVGQYRREMRGKLITLFWGVANDVVELLEVAFEYAARR